MERTAGRATRIRLLDVRTVPMRAFHVTWLAFFVAFFAWFAVAPLMPYVREDLGLTTKQIALANVAAVGVTILARLVVGRLCDLFGPRRTYSALLAFSAVPVAALGLVDSYPAFVLARLGIGVVGASFVLTQFHTSSMFAPSVVGTANAVTAGWGNLGGGVTQMTMPLVVAALVAVGMEHGAWRAAMVVPAVALLGTAVLYWKGTLDTPAGNYPEHRPTGTSAPGSFLSAAKDPRVAVLALAYAACFGVELTVNANAALYFHDRFGLAAGHAAFLAGVHGAMNLFARALGGWVGDRVGGRVGLRGRVYVLAATLALEALALVVFARQGNLSGAIVWLIAFSLFVEMGCGATYSVVPMVNRRAVGAVSGIVGAGGNLGAVAFGLILMGGQTFDTVFLAMGAVASVAAVLSTTIRFSAEDEAALAGAAEPGLSVAG